MIKFVPIEKEIYQGGVLIPVTVRRTVYDGIRITAFDELVEGIRRIERGDVFSDDSFKQITDICEKSGYHIEEVEDSHDLIYERRGGGDYSGKALRVTEEARELDNLTEYDLEEIFFANERAFMCVCDGKIVSIAAENPITELEGTTEIAVFTAEGYRGRGFARECINALCADINGRVIYLCGVDNPISAKTAENCGFEKIGQVKYFVAYCDQE